MFLKPGAKKPNKNNLVAPTGHEPLCRPQDPGHRLAPGRLRPP